MRAHQHARAPRSTGANFDRPVEVARPVNGDLDYLVIPRSYAGKSGRFKGLISSVAMINPLEASTAAIRRTSGAPCRPLGPSRLSPQNARQLRCRTAIRDRQTVRARRQETIVSVPKKKLFRMTGVPERSSNGITTSLGMFGRLRLDIAEFASEAGRTSTLAAKTPKTRAVAPTPSQIHRCREL